MLLTKAVTQRVLEMWAAFLVGGYQIHMLAKKENSVLSWLFCITKTYLLALEQEATDSNMISGILTFSGPNCSSLAQCQWDQ